MAGGMLNHGSRPTGNGYTTRDQMDLGQSLNLVGYNTRRMTVGDVVLNPKLKHVRV